MLLDRIVRAHQQRQAVVSEMMLTPKVNAVLEQIRHVATNLIVLHPALDQGQRTKLDREASDFLKMLAGTQTKLANTERELKTMAATINPGQRAAIERTRQNLQRAFK